MKDKNFKNVVDLFAALGEFAEQSRANDSNFMVISGVLMSVEAVAKYCCDSLTRESDEGDQTVKLLSDSLDDPNFVILPGEAETVARRIREANRLASSIGESIKERLESAKGRKRLQTLAGLFGCDDLGEIMFGEEECASDSEIVEGLHGIFKQFSDKEFGDTKASELLMLMLGGGYAICLERIRSLEKKAKEENSELEGDEASEYEELLRLRSEMQDDARVYCDTHPGVSMEMITGLNDFSESLDKSDDDGGADEDIEDALGCILGST